MARKQAIAHLNTILVGLQNDCFILFKALCRLAIKSSEPAEAMSLRSKTLTLELILSVLDNSGPAFRSSPQFIHLVKKDLVQVLLSNLISTSDLIFRLASQTFLALVAHFKVHLKREIGSFIQTIFLKIIDSNNRHAPFCAFPHALYVFVFSIH